jgi:hypothetical protein
MPLVAEPEPGAQPEVDAALQAAVRDMLEGDGGREAEAAERKEKTKSGKEKPPLQGVAPDIEFCLAFRAGGWRGRLAG